MHEPPPNCNARLLMVMKQSLLLLASHQLYFLYEESLPLALNKFGHVNSIDQTP